MANLLRRRRDAKRWYVGVVATRNWVPNDATTINGGLNQRLYHYARDNITSLRVAFPGGWYKADANGAETSSPPPISAVYGSIEYPSGVCHQLTWGGSTSWAPTAGVTTFSDTLQVSIPNGARFWTRMFVQGSSAYVSWVNYSVYGSATTIFTDISGGGDAANSTNSNETMTGTVTDDGSFSPYGFFPTLAIVGPTRNPSFGLLGDSRMVGFNDTVAANAGDSGEAARSIGPAFGYLNMGCPAEATDNYLTGSTLRRGLLQYCSHIITEYGFADVDLYSATAAQVEGYLASLYGLSNIVGKPIFQDTFLPYSASTDGWATTGNQTTSASFNPIRNTLNSWIRGGANGFGQIAGYNDVCIPVEAHPLGSGIWDAPGFTNDGVHPSPAGYLDIMNGGVFVTSRFRLV